MGEENKLLFKPLVFRFLFLRAQYNSQLLRKLSNFRSSIIYTKVFFMFLLWKCSNTSKMRQSRQHSSFNNYQLIAKHLSLIPPTFPSWVGSCGGGPACSPGNHVVFSLPPIDNPTVSPPTDLNPPSMMPMVPALASGGEVATVCGFLSLS